MNPLEIIEKYYKKDSLAHKIITAHGELVAKKAVKIAKKIGDGVDKDFIYEAAMLHDIGMIYTDAPEIGCNGNNPYITHGILGKKLLDEEGLPKHGLVCERHTGTGISKEEILEKKFPLPQKDMIPVTLEEEIICYADKFFSKDPKRLFKEKSPDKVKKVMKKYGGNHLDKFKEWHKKFKV